MTTKFTDAVRPGDTIRLEQKVLEKKETSKPDRGVLSNPQYSRPTPTNAVPADTQYDALYIGQFIS